MTRITTDEYIKATKKSDEKPDSRSNERKKQAIVRMHNYIEGEIVWCKMRGFPLWPARVSRVFGKLKNFKFKNFKLKNFHIIISDYKLL